MSYVDTDMGMKRSKAREKLRREKFEEHKRLRAGGKKRPGKRVVGPPLKGRPGRGIAIGERDPSRPEEPGKERHTEFGDEQARKKRGDPARFKLPIPKRPAPKRKVPSSKLGRRLAQRLKRLLKRKGRKGKLGRGKLRRRGGKTKREGVGGHMAIIDGKNWDGSPNRPGKQPRGVRTPARRRQVTRSRKARKAIRKGESFLK
jgi:hypothetical protein